MDIKDIIERLKNPEENFPLLLSSGNISEARSSRFADSLKKSAAYLEEGVIPNARYKEQAEYMNRMSEESFSRNVSDPYIFGEYRNLQGPVIDLYDSLNSSNLTSIGSSIKKLAKFMKASPEHNEHPIIVATRNVFSELNVLVQAGDHLKGMAQKRVVKSEEEKEAESKYIPPMANRASFELVNNKLKEITDGLYNDLIQSRIKINTNIFDRAMYKSANGAKYDDYTPNERYIVNKFAKKESTMPGSKYIANPNYVSEISEFSVMEADSIRDSFVIKNLRKLASIIDGKNNLSDIEIVARSVSLTGMEGTLKINFSDNSSFKVTNQVVLSTSSLGKQFYRFPLIFRDVRMPDGKSHAKASEEWMNESFGGVNNRSSDRTPSPGM